MNIKSSLIGLAGAAALSVTLSAPASAVTITGGVSDISFNTTDPGLIISAAPLSFGSITLNNVNDFQFVDVMRIGTPEGTVNTNFLSLFGEDTTPLPISATFTFSSPASLVGSVSGSTFGYIAPLTSCGFLAGGCGAVSWGAPILFNFGNGGQFKVELFDTTFGTPGAADVKARFTLLANSVPEPATWAMLIFGFGAIGAAMRRRQRQTVSYTFA
ncbi:MAG: PEP-CTERM sorting domain-containing protein [Sphingomonadales bacterium]|nr:MAG: PEP-CTERM sorting domain-containing protein [Sphingomonadales bacterium]TNF02872.1 MAG: PEP-CTERM sorting domain-containing protein [Sphingomonadales bacterium]